jgi:hypothetical protein
VTGLTGASPWWILSRGTIVFMWFGLVVLLVSSWLVWSWFARSCEEFSFLVGCVLEVVFVPGPRGVTKASWDFIVHLLFVTGLTGRVQRSDRQEPSV